MPKRDIIVIGASAGGVEALSRLVAALPAKLPAAVFVVIHIPLDAASMLPRILDRAGPLPAMHAGDQEPIEDGRIYVARPDRHLFVYPGFVRSVPGPRENHARPAVDPLFRSAALAYGERVVGVVLTGTLDDGSSGLAAIKRQGGLTIVQDPSDALFPGMPQNALDTVDVDYCVPLHDIAGLLADIVKQDAITPDSGEGVVRNVDSDDLEYEVRVAALDETAVDDDRRPGEPSPFACPDCGGVLWELHNSKPLRFRCRVGHAYTADNLLAAHDGGLESALWIALRTLEEKVSLTRRLARRARELGMSQVAARFDAQTASTEQAAQVVHSLLREQIATAEIDPAKASAD